MQKQEDERDIQSPIWTSRSSRGNTSTGFDEGRRRQAEPLVRFRGRGTGTSGISAGKEDARFLS